MASEYLLSSDLTVRDVTVSDFTSYFRTGVLQHAAVEPVYW
jgi:hypothetical protein